MIIKLHKNARTTPAIRAEIAASNDSAAALSERYGVTVATVYKWKSRTVFTDGSHTAKRLQTTLSPAQETIAVELRETLLLPLDDLLAVMQDFAARVLCDNLRALACLAAQDEHLLPAAHRINHTYAHTVLKPILPVLLLAQTGLRLFADAMRLLASHTCKHRQGLSKPRPPRRKPHKHMTQKPC